MIYYKIIQGIKEPYISKYNVEYNANKLQEIKKEIINKCGQIHHMKCKSNTPNPTINKEYIQNLNVQPIYKHNYIKEYILDYDYIAPIHEVELINKVLNKDSTSLEELLDIIYSETKEEKNTYQLKTNELNTKISMYLEAINTGAIPISIGCKEIERLKIELNEIEKYSNINKDKVPVSTFYQKLRETFIFEPISYLTINDFNKVVDFFEEEIESKITRIRKKRVCK